MNYNIIIVILILIALFTLFKKENYSRIIPRYSNTQCSGNTCKYPSTNNKLNTLCNKEVAKYQYGDRFIKNPNKYLEMVARLLDDLSSSSKMDNYKLTDKNFLGDPDYLTQFMNLKVNKLIQDKEYLQKNGSWKYENFYISEPTIHYYSTDEQNINVFKIIYTLGNPLRSSYTSCIAFIKEHGEQSGKLEIVYTTFLNEFETNNNQSNLDVIPKEALNFSFLGTLANIDTTKFGNSGNYSGINDIYEKHDEKLNIKADIPDEFKENNFKVQILPPLFGNGVIDYPENKELDISAFF